MILRRAQDLGARVVAVTHELECPDPLLEELNGLGIEVLEWSAVRTRGPADPEPLKTALQELDSFEWLVFTSRRAVTAVQSLVADMPRTVRIAAVGSRVEAAVASAGWTAEVVGHEGAEALAGLLTREVSPGARVLFPAGALASRAMEDPLRAHGAHVRRVEAYRTEPAALAGVQCAADLGSGRVEAVSFLSPSAVEGVVHAAETAGCGQELRRLRAVCVGATTASSAAGHGFSDVHVSPEASKQSVACVLADLLAQADRISSEPDHNKSPH